MACNPDHGEECHGTSPPPPTSSDEPDALASSTDGTSTGGVTQASGESSDETTGDEPVDFGPYPEGPYGFSVGDTFPPLTFFDAQGIEVSMQDLRDGSKTVIVLFGWAPWCGPSIQHMAELEGALGAIGTAHLLSPITDDLVDHSSVPSESDVAYLNGMYPNASVVADVFQLLEMGTLEDEDALYVSVGEVWLIDADTMQIGYADRFLPNASEIGAFLAEHDACPPKVPCLQDDDCGTLGPGTAGGGYVCNPGLGLCCQPQQAFPDGECPKPFSASFFEEDPVCRFTCGDQGCL